MSEPVPNGRTRMRDFTQIGLTFDAYDLSRLASTSEDVAKLSSRDRDLRVNDLVAEAHWLVDLAKTKFITDDKRNCAATVVLFSGGNDSTVLAHLMRDRVTHYGHADTGIGVRATRQFVKETCESWGVPLVERFSRAYDDSYEAHVLKYGFPGPAMHYKMYQRLKERGFRIIRSDLLGNRSPLKWRVMFLAGRRRDESTRRADVPEFEREGSIVWASPLINWTKPDLARYRKNCGLTAGGTPVPLNPVTSFIHMSGECMCGAFAHGGELDELRRFLPDEMSRDLLDQIADLEEKIADSTTIPWWAKTWGWGGDPVKKAAADAGRKRKTPKVGRLCGGCPAPQLSLF